MKSNPQEDEQREALRKIVTRNGHTGRITELLEDELDKLQEYIRQYAAKARIDERRTIKKLWDKLGMVFGASAGSAIGVTVRNDFGEEWDFQLDRDAVNDLIEQLKKGQER